MYTHTATWSVSTNRNMGNICVMCVPVRVLTRAVGIRYRDMARTLYANHKSDV